MRATGGAAVLPALLIVCFAGAAVASLQTSGRFIMDENGHRVKLACANWYGAGSTDYAFGGLQWQSAESIAETIKTLGFNCVRVPFSNELVEDNPHVNATKVAAIRSQLPSSPRAFDVMDVVLAALARVGLHVILDNHVSNAGWCCSHNDNNGLWFNEQYSEDQWVADWLTMVQRYATNGTYGVIAVDLRNELRVVNKPDGSKLTPVWGGGGTYDWRRAAGRAGNAILAAAPHLLIIVEGLGYSVKLTEYGANMLSLSVPNRLVYEAHNYPWDWPSGITQGAFDAQLDSWWGYLLASGVPVWVGEWGTCHTDSSCFTGTGQNGLYFQYFTAYLEKHDVDWSVWAIDGTESTGKTRTYGSEETFGVLDTTWTKPASGEYMKRLQQLMPCTLNCAIESA